jgi:hypothetical protein
MLPVSRRALPLLWFILGEALVLTVTIGDLQDTPSDPGSGLRTFWIGQVVVIGGLLVTAIINRRLQGGGPLGTVFQIAGLIGFLSFCWWAVHGPDQGFNGTPWIRVTIASVVVQAATSLLILHRGDDR